MSKPYKVELKAKTSKAKMALIGFYVLLLFVFAFMDIAVNTYWGKELPTWGKYYIIPIKEFLGLFGTITVPDYWLFYAQSMFLFFFLLFLYQIDPVSAMETIAMILIIIVILPFIIIYLKLKSKKENEIDENNPSMNNKE